MRDQLLRTCWVFGVLVGCSTVGLFQLSLHRDVVLHHLPARVVELVFCFQQYVAFLPDPIAQPAKNAPTSAINHSTVFEENCG